MSIIRDVAVFTCDNNEQFAHRPDREPGWGIVPTAEAGREVDLPDGWLTVEFTDKVGEDRSFLTFCSLRCALDRLRAIEKAEREAPEAAAPEAVPA